MQLRFPTDTKIGTLDPKLEVGNTNWVSEKSFYPKK